MSYYLLQVFIYSCYMSFNTHRQWLVNQLEWPIKIQTTAVAPPQFRVCIVATNTPDFSSYLQSCLSYLWVCLAVAATSNGYCSKRYSVEDIHPTKFHQDPCFVRYFANTKDKQRSHGQKPFLPFLLKAGDNHFYRGFSSSTSRLKFHFCFRFEAELIFI